jgi:uncharacterized membrane protein YozB (DUF420 family)
VDAKVLYWTGALVNMAVVVGSAGLGVWHVRAGRIPQHRRCMLLSASLVLAFVGSYAIKLAVLGREDLSVWADAYVQTLRFHETCVFLMVLGGAIALSRAWKMRNSRNVTSNEAAETAPASTLIFHRRSGWVAVAASIFGVVSAGVVLVGMYQRLEV